MSFSIRNFTEQDFQTILKWSTEQKWNPGVYDHIAFTKAFDPKSFWMGILDGEPIGCVGIVQYDQNFSHVGNYIVRQAYRKKGYGIQIWKKAMQLITAKNISLEGVLAQQPNYVKSGFKTEHKTTRFQFVGGTNKQQSTQNLVDCRKIDIQKLSNYDRTCFPSYRRDLVQSWINLPESKAIAYIQNDKIRGYGVLRVSADGFRVGPLYADSHQIAEQIIKSLQGAVQQNKNICIDIPTNNENALRLADNLNMKQICTFAKMYTNGLPSVQLQNIYGVFSIQYG